jgi:ferredoxin
MDTITINGKQLAFLPGETVLAAAKRAGEFIPTLCHDDRLEPYASCGVCIVEVEGSPRLVRACSTIIAAGQSILTDSPRALATRKSALDLLLSDHRGDCRPPCVEACPAKTDCQGYLGLLANGEYREAILLLKELLPLPASIGRVCPHPCETACRRKLVEEPISIAHIKSHIADHDLRSGPYVPEVAPGSGKRVAVVGHTIGEKYMRETGARLVALETLEEAVDALMKGDADALVMDAAELEYWVFHHPEMDVEVVGGIFSPYKYAFAVNKKHAHQMDRVSEEVIRLLDDGTVENLKNKYFGRVRF